MATLSDDDFKTEFANMLAGKDTSLGVLKETPPDPAAVVTPPVDTVITAPDAVVPPVDAPVIESTPAKTAEELAAEAVAAAAAKPTDAPVVVDANAPVKTAEELAAEATAAAEAAAAEPDYKKLYTAIVGTPFKAGGKEMTVVSAEEAISLMQKGVGFHNKLNRVQGDLKLAEMLKNNGITESQLSLLIDAQLGKPGAIKKLLDSAKIDPLTLDSAEASNFAPTDHRVTDNQVRFNSVVSDLTETTHGTAVLTDANGWDQASKAAIYKTPEVLEFLALQKESGLYDQIKTQVERQKLLGNIPPTQSFIESYTIVGQQMRQAGAIGNQTPTPTPTPTPVAQKVITPTPPPNAKAAAAAAGTRKTVPAANNPAAVDIKTMSDDDFNKHFRTVFKI